MKSEQRRGYDLQRVQKKEESEEAGREQRSKGRRVVTEKARRRRRLTGEVGGRRKLPSGTHVLWSTHQPQWGSPEPRHSLQLRY